MEISFFFSFFYILKTFSNSTHTVWCMRYTAHDDDDKSAAGLNGGRWETDAILDPSRAEGRGLIACCRPDDLHDGRHYKSGRQVMNAPARSPPPAPPPPAPPPAPPPRSPPHRHRSILQKHLLNHLTADAAPRHFYSTNS